MKDGISPAALGAAVKGDLKNFIVASTPGGIESQEKEGQIEFGTNETLPIEMLHGICKDDFIKLGFVFGKHVDDTFQECRFPAGWKKEATDHSMWSKLIDHKGRIRGMIFFKAAFYDYNAHVALNNYYSIEGLYDNDDCVVGEVIDPDKNVVFSTKEYTITERKEAYDIRNLAREECVKWLKENKPEWENHMVYWDNE